MYKLVLLCLLMFSACVNASNERIVFGLNTRVIFDLSSNARSFTLTNDTSTSYLINMSIHENNPEGSISENFMVTPEVFKLKHNTTTNVTIRRLNGVFPQDRESLLYITGRWIPEVNDSSEERKMDLLYSFTQKVFIRPSKLIKKDAVDKSLEDICFKYRDGALVISNKSPYHLTFYRFLVDGISIELPASAKMLDPFKTYYLKLSNKPKKIKWSLIGDSGYETATAERIFGEK